MNKKLALLMFAIGLGAASAPALATSCQAYCQAAKIWCLNNTSDAPACMDTFIACMESC
jgi:hypothetical protein